MSKYLVYCLLLWQVMSVMSSKIGVGGTDRKIPYLSATNELEDTELNGKYSIRSENQTFNIKGVSPLQDCSAPCHCVCCDRLVRGSNRLESNEKNAFKLHLQKQSWNKARKICAEQGGYLAVPQSNEEETEILKMMLKDSVEDAWLGIHDQFEEGDWITVLDEPLGETGWAKWSKSFVPNPDNYAGKQHCARIVRDGGGMDDDLCSNSKSFVCNIPKLIE